MICIKFIRKTKNARTPAGTDKKENHSKVDTHLGYVLAGHLRPGVPQVVRLRVSVLVLLHVLLRVPRKKKKNTNKYVRHVKQETKRRVEKL